MVKQKKSKKEMKIKIDGILDFIDLILNLIPGKGLTLMLFLGAICGGLIGYDMGYNSVEIQDCPISECPEIVCEECVDCKELNDYSDEELVKELYPDYTCDKIRYQGY
tara:strand:+ start:1689 stop:2012 length:324 start_codon:yes stop_codon:yes gene_type:complete